MRWLGLLVFFAVCPDLEKFSGRARRNYCSFVLFVVLAMQTVACALWWIWLRCREVFITSWDRRRRDHRIVRDKPNRGGLLQCFQRRFVPARRRIMAKPSYVLNNNLR
ncbi:hypothetical protein Pla52o_05880 [Novipirellula galeiformis]|uniref:Uncharacterized protein n=1 Tax=Novipirellula galeiformis TaxID=2528004 RepID=A0A5C6CS85_9BACT|nr:hypothetical protein Pla52o_05880 [Novipirellula galeiformis]